VLASLVAACAKQSEAALRAPDFTLQTIDGESVTLSDFRGKPVMVSFWTVNCPSCAFQIPYIQAFYDESSSEEVAVLTINVGESATVVQDYVTSYGFTFPILLDSETKVAQSYGIPGVPVTFFIDADGLIKAYKIGPFMTQEEMESLFESL